VEKVLYLTKNYLYIYENDRVVRKEYSKDKGIVTSTILLKDIYNINFKLPKDLKEEELIIEAEKYVFTEGALDYTKQYKINYIFQDLGDFYFVDAFVVELETLKEIFASHLKLYKYIDFISPAPLVFKEYYNITNIKPQVDVFIYFNQEDAFLSCFKNGEFVFTKSINKLNVLSANLNISVEECIELLKQKGLNKELYEDEDVYNKIYSFFSQFFMKVNNILNYSINFYHLDKINKIYFYSPFEIKNLFESYIDFWNLSGIEFKKYEIESEYDSFDITAAFFNARHYQDEKINFSIFNRPLPFYKQETGKIIILILVLFSIIGADAFYRYKKINQEEVKLKKLKIEHKRKQRELASVKIGIKKYQKLIKNIKEENLKIQSRIDLINTKLVTLYKIVQTPPITNEFADIIVLLKKHSLKITEFSKNKNMLTVTIVSEYDNSSEIAKFMKDLLKFGFKDVYSKQILSKENKYISKVEFKDE